MKKLFTSLVAVVLALSLPGLPLAQEKVKKDEPAVSTAGAGKSTEMVKSEEAKGKEKAGETQVSAESSIWRTGGLVTAVDPKAETISIHQETVHHDRVMELRVDKKVSKELSNIRTGDTVNVWIKGRVIKAINKVS